MLISHPGKEDVLALEALLKHKIDVNTKDTKGFRVRRHFLHLHDTWNSWSLDLLVLLLDHG